MSANVGGIDRTLRIVVGLGVLGLFFIFDGTNRWWALVVLVPLATGLVGWCPAYLPFRVSTCKNS